MRAFLGDPTIKAALLAALDNKGDVPLVEPGGATEPRLVEWAREIGVAPSLILLAARCFPSLGVAVDVAAVAFARQLLSKIDVGAETSGIAHAWLVWAWEGAPESLAASMPSPERHQTAADAVALHRRAASGEVVTRGAWRASRVRLNSLAQADDEQGRAAAVFEAGAWDLNLAPGAADDALHAWEGLYRARIRRADGWGEAEDSRLEGMLNEVRPILRERVGASPGRGDPTALDAYIEQWRTEFGGLMAAYDDPIWDRYTAQQKTIGEALSRLREQGRAGILHLVRETSLSDRLQWGGEKGAASNG